jgi:membrane protein insertase Oxa1/YidC/SpoIIIJ
LVKPDLFNYFFILKTNVLEEKTPEQMEIIEEIRKPLSMPKWIPIVIIATIFLLFWYLSRNSGATKSNSFVLQAPTTNVILAIPVK